jgi:hypothetical protein
MPKICGERVTAVARQGVSAPALPAEMTLAFEAPGQKSEAGD